MLHQHIPQPSLVVLIATPQATALKSNPLLDKVCKVCTTRIAWRAEGGQIDNVAIARNGLKVPSKVFGADEVDDDIDAFAIGSLENLLVPLSRRCVECRLATKLLDAEVTLVVGARRGEHG